MLVCQDRRDRHSDVEKCSKDATCRLHLGRILRTATLEDFVRHAPTGPAGNTCRKINVSPFWMAWSLAELVPFSEKGLNEPFDAPVAIRSPRPIDNRKHGRARNPIHG